MDVFGNIISVKIEKTSKIIEKSAISYCDVSALFIIPFECLSLSRDNHIEFFNYCSIGAEKLFRQL